MNDVLQTHRELLVRLLGTESDEFPVRRGQFFTVILGSDRVVCLPRTPAAAGRLGERRASLAALAKLDLGFRTPVPIAFDAGLDAPTAYLVTTRVLGSPLAQGEPNDWAGAEAVASQYRDLLLTLRRVAPEVARLAAVPRASRDRWRAFASDVRDHLFGLMSAGGRERAEHELSAVEALPYVSGPLVHGDLGSGNVLWQDVAGVPQLSGVVDWDEATLGDQAEDLAAIGASNGQALLDRILHADEFDHDGLLRRIEAIRGSFALQQAVAAHRDGDQAELADGLSNYR